MLGYMLGYVLGYVLGTPRTCGLGLGERLGDLVCAAQSPPSMEVRARRSWHGVLARALVRESLSFIGIRDFLGTGSDSYDRLSPASIALPENPKKRILVIRCDSR